MKTVITKIIIFLFLISFSVVINAETVPMKYCKLDCITFILETTHNDVKSMLSSDSSSSSSESVYSFVKQYCEDFVSDEIQCITRTKNNKHKLLTPFSWKRGFLNKDKYDF